MMVIQEENDKPVEMALKKPLYEQKKYVIVKNHVRELSSGDSGSDFQKVSVENSLENPKNAPKNVTFQSHSTTTKRKKNNKTLTSNDKSEVHLHTEISKSDLEELKTVYKNCKAVIKKIKTKYGHLLDLDKPGTSKLKIQENFEKSEEESECHCTLNKKIVYDDDGNEVQMETTLDNHICPKKPKIPVQNYEVKENDRIQVDYSDMEIQLPEDIQELTKLLQNPDTETAIRYKVIEKIKSIKQEYLNEIKFNKRAIIEKLKSNPDEVFDFKGSNLSSLPGYS